MVGEAVKVFNDGFESGTFGSWSTAGSVAIVSWPTFPIHGGFYAAQATGPNSRWEKDLGGSGYADLFFAGYFKVPSMLANGQKTFFLYIFDASYNHWVAGGLKREGGNTYWVLNVNDQDYDTETPEVQTNKWYLMQIEYDKTNGIAKLWVEGAHIRTVMGQTLPNNARIIRGGNPSNVTPQGFVTYGDDYSANDSENTSEVDNSTVDNILKIKTYQSDDWVNIRNVLSPTLAPLLQIDQGMWCTKDIFTNGFLGTDSPDDGPHPGTGGGAVMIGHGLTDVNDPPRITLTDDGSSQDTNTLYITNKNTPSDFYPNIANVNNYMANLRTAKLVSTSVDCGGEVHGGGSSGDAFLVGDDIHIVDVNEANTMCLQGNQDRTYAKIYFGSNKDVNLYRWGPNLLKTDADFHAQGGSLYVGNQNASYLYIGNDGTTWDIKLYRSTTGGYPHLRLQTPVSGGMVVEQSLWCNALSTPFVAIYRAPDWNNPLLQLNGGQSYPNGIKFIQDGPLSIRNFDVSSGELFNVRDANDNKRFTVSTGTITSMCHINPSAGNTYGLGSGDAPWLGAVITTVYTNNLGTASGSTIAPSANNSYYLGSSSYYWYRIYANTYYGKTTTIQSFDALDDLALLKNLEIITIEESGVQKQIFNLDTLPFLRPDEPD